MWAGSLVGGGERRGNVSAHACVHLCVNACTRNVRAVFVCVCACEPLCLDNFGPPGLTTPLPCMLQPIKKAPPHHHGTHQGSYKGQSEVLTTYTEAYHPNKRSSIWSPTCKTRLKENRMNVHAHCSSICETRDHTRHGWSTKLRNLY